MSLLQNMINRSLRIKPTPQIVRQRLEHLKQHGRMIVWLANLDSSKSRRQGRRLPRASCLEMPKLAEVEDASRALGLESTSRSDTARPSRPWEKTGYIMVDRKGKTRDFTLKSLAQAIQRSRQTKPKGKPS